MKIFLKEARRFFRGSPLICLSGILVLALGIGASALALTLLYVFSSLTYPGMRALGYATIAEESEGGGSVRISWDRIEALQAATHSGAALAAYSESLAATLRADGVTLPVRVASTSVGFFPSFTGPLVAGRDFTHIEEGLSRTHVVVLGPSLSAELFNSPADSLDRIITLNGVTYRVVGVAPHGFRGVFGQPADAWVPPSNLIEFLPGVSPSDVPTSNIWKEVALFYGVAASDRFSSATLAKQVEHALPVATVGQSPLHVSQGLTIDPVSDIKLRRWFRVSFLLAFIFSIVSCLNYSLLLLARTPRHIEEVRLKKALGADSGRLALELASGPAAMAGTAFFLSVFLVLACISRLSRMPGHYHQLAAGSEGAAIVALGFEFLFACFLAGVIALLPLFFILRDNGAPRMGYTSTASKRTGLLLQVPVIFQMTFCAAVWILASMISASLINTLRLPLGFDADHLTIVQAGQVVDELTGGGKGHSFPSIDALRSVLASVLALPGVRSASYAAMSPLDDRPLQTIRIERIDQSSPAPHTVYSIWVSPGFFQTLGTRFLAGRGFSQTPQMGGIREIVINRRLAQELWPGENPVDHTVRLIYPAAWGMPSSSEFVTVDGIADNMRYSGFSESPVPTLFFSAYQGSMFDTAPRLIVRGIVSPHQLVDSAGPLVQSLMPGLDVVSTYSVRDRLSSALAPEKRRAELATVGALILAILSAVGLYGSLNYYVGTMRRNLAIRICFGATPWAVRNTILMRAMICAGAAIGMSLPLWLVLVKLSSTEYLGQVAWSTERTIVIMLAYACISSIVSIGPATAATRIAPSELLKEQ